MRFVCPDPGPCRSFRSLRVRVPLPACVCAAPGQRNRMWRPSRDGLSRTLRAFLLWLCTSERFRRLGATNTPAAAPAWRAAPAARASRTSQQQPSSVVLRSYHGLHVTERNRHVTTRRTRPHAKAAARLSVACHRRGGTQHKNREHTSSSHLLWGCAPATTNTSHDTVQRAPPVELALNAGNGSRFCTTSTDAQLRSLRITDTSAAAPTAALSAHQRPAPSSDTATATLIAEPARNDGCGSRLLAVRLMCVALVEAAERSP